ncbi:MAG: hypothetical protein Kow0080_30600 [Candidatus Promineifilaceae bacterium]
MRNLLKWQRRERLNIGAGWWLGIALLILMASSPLWGAPPRGDDLFPHYFRIPVVRALWQQGVFFSRWSPYLVFGYGYPLFLFYPPLTAYLLTAVYTFIIQNGPVAYNLTNFLAIVLAGTGMFYLGRRLYGVKGAFLASAAYVLSPWFLYQIYARGSLSNAWAMALFPWAMAGLLSVGQGITGRRLLGTATAIAALMLAHTAASLIFIAPLLFVGLVGAAANSTQPTATDERPKRYTLLFAAMAVTGVAGIGVLLAAFSWLPALTEISVTRYQQEIDIVDSTQFFGTAWAWPEPFVAHTVNPPLAHTAGMVQVLLGVAGGLAAAVGLRWVRQGKRPFSATQAIILTCAIIGLGTLFLATKPSTWLWQNLPILAQFQFPWRFLDLPAFFLPVAGGYLLAVLPHHKEKQANGLMALAIVALFVTAVPYLSPARRLDLPKQPTLNDVTAVQQRFHVYGVTGWGEYSAATVTEWPAGPPFPGADQNMPLHQKLHLPNGVTMLQAKGDSFWAEWQFQADQPETLTMFVHDFPGWQAMLDERPLPIQPDSVGRITLSIPAGTHTVRLAWQRTPIRRLADSLTAAAFGILGLWVFWRKGRQPAPAASAKPDGAPAAMLILLLVVLLGVKLAWLDRFPSPWLIYPAENGTIAEWSQPAWRNFAGLVTIGGVKLDEPDRLTIYWQSQQNLTQSLAVEVTLTDWQGAPLAVVRHDTPGESATTTWQAGEWIRDVYVLPVDVQDAPYAYRVYVSVLAETGDALPLVDAGDAPLRVEVAQTKRAPEKVAVPETAVAVNANFANAITLSHVELPQQITVNTPVNMTFYWQSHTRVTADYTLFVHLVDENGNYIAGHDSQPVQGHYPTSMWTPGETIADNHQWQANILPGTYEVQVGLYQLKSGERLPLAEGGDTLSIGMLTVLGND